MKSQTRLLLLLTLAALACRSAPAPVRSAAPAVATGPAPVVVAIVIDQFAAWIAADRLALLSEGRIVMQGTPQEFLDSTNPKVREFLERDFDNPTLAA